MCVCVLDLNAWHFSCWEMMLGAQNVVWIFGWVACLIAFISLFFSSLKNYVLAISIASRYLSTARLSIKPLELLFLIAIIVISIHQGFRDLVSIASWSIEEEFVCSIASRFNKVLLLWTPLDSYICRIFILDTSRYLSIPLATNVFIYRVNTTFLSFLPDLSQQNLSPHLPKLISLSL